MIEVEKLKEKMREKGVSIQEMLDVLGIAESTFYRKVAKSGRSFTIEEAQKIVRALDLSASDATAIFFNGELA